MLVKATRTLYYGLKRIKEGQKFELKPVRMYKRDSKGNVVKGRDGKPVVEEISAEAQFSARSMMKVENEKASKKKREVVDDHDEQQPIETIDTSPDELSSSTGDEDVL